ISGIGRCRLHQRRGDGRGRRSFSVPIAPANFRLLRHRIAQELLPFHVRNVATTLQAAPWNVPLPIMVDGPVGMRSRWHTQPADTAAEAMLVAAKLAGIERLWFVAGLELTFFQESVAKHLALGRPTPRVMTMTHENAALAAACGETMVSRRPSMTAFHVECGLLNAGAAIHNANRGQYPVLITSGYAPSAENTTVPGARNSAIQYVQHVPDQAGLVR